jgi:hypothetical protein
MVTLNPQQKKALRKQLSSRPELPELRCVEGFLVRFFFFESLLRILGRYYRDRNARTKKTTARDTLNIDVVGRSLSYFGVRISVERLELLMSSGKTKKHEKSARNLRNGIVHHWSAPEISEVNLRHETLINALDEAITSIRTCIT